MPVLTRLALALALLLASAGAAAANTTPPPVTNLVVRKVEPVGRFGGVDYVRYRGVLSGWVFARLGDTPTIAGFNTLPKTALGTYGEAYPYQADFEIIAPAKGQPADEVVFVEAENRGNPIFLGALNGFAAGGAVAKASYPAGLGDGFLFRHHIAYARVDWQTGITDAVPKDAQGVGEVIMRDFGALLDQGTGDGPPPFKTRLLGAISQSSWFINAFVAEGYNADPTVGDNEDGPVFNGVIAIDGTGNWIPINELGAQAGFPQYPYPNEASHPLTPRQLFTRPKSDPLYLDVANFTDFYRLRASLSESGGPLPANMRRYDWPSPHAAGSATGAARIAAGGCNDGKVVPLDPIGYAPYARALVLELARAAGARSLAAPTLPPSRLFKLTTAPDDATHFNALPGADVRVPARDARGQPIGGVRFPEDDLPVGRITVSLPHVGLDSITDACGNLAVWAPMTPPEAAKAYGAKAAYLKRYGAQVDRLVTAGYVLAEDKAAMLVRAGQLYDNPAGY